jgi:hypothetical protein
VRARRPAPRPPASRVRPPARHAASRSIRWRRIGCVDPGQLPDLDPSPRLSALPRHGLRRHYGRHTSLPARLSSSRNPSVRYHPYQA